MQDSDGLVKLAVLVYWLRDIVKELIKKFRVYSQWRNKVLYKQESDVLIVRTQVSERVLSLECVTIAHPPFEHWGAAQH